MSDPVTIQIAKALHAAIRAVVPDGTNVYARGVQTNSDGEEDTGAIDIERRGPMVEIIPHEGAPTDFKYSSALVSYPVRVRVVTAYSRDKWSIDLYTVAEPVGEYLRTAPAIKLDTVEFDALVMTGPPEVGNDGFGSDMQYMEWQLDVKTCRKT
jgi:hypothetical protein